MCGWIPVSGFKQQQKVSFDKWCCLNSEEYGSCPIGINAFHLFTSNYSNNATHQNLNDKEDDIDINTVNLMILNQLCSLEKLVKKKMM
jgi:hypothetical protein